jgi:hypothetical protein
MSRLKKLAAEQTNPEGTNPEESVKELTFDDIIAEKGEDVVKQAVLNYYEGYCLDTYLWKDIFSEAKVKDLKNMTYDEVVCWAQDDEESTWEQIKDALGYDDDVEFSDDIPSDITDFFDNKCYQEFEEKFEEFLANYIRNDHSVGTYDNTHENTYNNSYDNEHNNTYNNTNNTDPDEEEDDEDDGEEKPEAINNPAELADLEDAVGDVAKLSGNFNIDYPNREAPFVYIDGEIVEGDSSSSHTQVINKWCEENGIDPMKEKWQRQTPDRTMKAINKDSVAFGHIDEGMAFIETCVGVSPEEVLKALEDAGGYEKIYKWSRNGQTATRLAKLNAEMEERNKYYLRLYKRIFKNNKN